MWGVKPVDLAARRGGGWLPWFRCAAPAHAAQEPCLQQVPEAAALDDEHAQPLELLPPGCRWELPVRAEPVNQVAGPRAVGGAGAGGSLRRLCARPAKAGLLVRGALLPRERDRGHKHERLGGRLPRQQAPALRWLHSRVAVGAVRLGCVALFRGCIAVVVASHLWLWSRWRLRCTCGCDCIAVVVAVALHLWLRFCGCDCTAVVVAVALHLWLRLYCGCGCDCTAVVVAVALHLWLRLYCSCACDAVAVVLAWCLHCGALWSRFALQRAPVELEVRNGAVAVR
eukprot:350645-Chlamydomonas_euryale.AAC.3